MRTRIFSGIFFFVVLLMAVQNVMAQTTAPATSTTTTATAAPAQTGHTLEEISELLDRFPAYLNSQIGKKTVELNGPAHKKLKDADAENRKAIEAMRVERQMEIAAQIIVARGIKEPTTDQIAKVLGEADAILKIASLSERTKALAKAWTPTEDPRIAKCEDALVGMDRKIRDTAKATTDAIVIVSTEVDGKIDEVRNDLMDYATTGQVAAVSVDLKGQVADAKKIAEDAKKKAEEVAGKVTNLQGEVAYAQNLAEATARTVVRVVKDDEKLIFDYYLRLSRNGIRFADIELTLVDIQSRGLFGREPDTVEEFQKIIVDGFNDRGLTPAEAKARAEALTAGMMMEAKK